MFLVLVCLSCNIGQDHDGLEELVSGDKGIHSSTTSQVHVSPSLKQKVIAGTY